jgi:hypothetical protein
MIPAKERNLPDETIIVLPTSFDHGAANRNRDTK